MISTYNIIPSFYLTSTKHPVKMSSEDCDRVSSLRTSALTGWPPQATQTCLSLKSCTPLPLKSWTSPSNQNSGNICEKLDVPQLPCGYSYKQNKPCLWYHRLVIQPSMIAPLAAVNHRSESQGKVMRDSRRKKLYFKPPWECVKALILFWILNIHMQ